MVSFHTVNGKQVFYCVADAMSGVEAGFFGSLVWVTAWGTPQQEKSRGYILDGEGEWLRGVLIELRRVHYI